MDPALAAEDVRKAYGDTAALRGVSLAVAPGEVFALVGPNGAGKTTLVRCLTGTTAPDAGAATLLGAPPRRAERSRIGVLPQDFRPPDRLTARELIAYYAGLYDDARDVEGVLRDVGLTDAADTWYGRLSGGQQRRALVGTALVNDPAVLVLDEPTTGIDPAGRRAVWGLLDDLAAAGSTVFLTTHSMDEAERLADRVGVLIDGRLDAVGTPADLVAAYGGPSRLVIATDAAVELDGFSIRPVRRGVVVEDIRPRDIGAVVEQLETAGVAYGALTWREPDLETVYLELAGENAADELGRVAEVPGSPR